MQHLIRPYFLLILFAVLAGELPAQKYDFASYSVEEGLSQSEARSLFQDSRGYLWVGTAGGGVCRYDGISFTEYSSRQGLQGTIIDHIAEDSAYNMWFGTNNAGVSRFDGKNFRQYSLSNGLGDNYVTALASDRNRVLIGTGRGLYEYLVASDILRKVTSLNKINAIHGDLTGNMWVAADSSLYLLKGEKLERIDFPAEVIGKPAITALGSDNGGFLYVGTNNGILIFHHPTRKWSQSNLSRMLAGMNISSISRDHAGGVWFATRNNLVIRSDKQGKTDSYSSSNGLFAQEIFMVLEDNTHHIWMATRDQSLVKLKSEAFTYYGDQPGMGSYSVFRIFQSKNGDMWIGSNSDGLHRYDGTKSVPVLNGSVPFKQPVAIIQDSSDRIWVGHYTGLTSIVNGRASTTLVPGMRVRAACTDHNGNIWIGTWGNGLFKYDGKEVTNYTVKSGALPQDYIHDILEDSKGNIWLGTGSGLVKYDGKTFTTYLNNDFCNSYVGSIREDKIGNIWFHTDLCVMRFDGMNFYSYDQDQGLASNTVYLIEFDEQGRLWVGTNKGLDCITMNGDAQFVTVRNYGKNEGFKGVECNSRAVCRTRQGQLWFGTVKGVISYDPKNDQRDNTEPRVHITGIRLFLEETDWTWSGAQQGGWFQLPVSLTLEHDHNHLTFSYVGIHLQNPGSTRYKFMLAGFDSTWQPITSRTEITYSNLPPGQYVFRVMAANSENKWNGRPAESCIITILPAPVPFYASWWFILLVMIILGGGLYYITVLRSRIIRKQKEELEQQIRERTQEISRQNEEKSLMLKEIHHRVKNNLQVISSLLNLQAEKIEDPKVLSQFEDLRYRVNSMALIHEKMYESRNLVNIDIEGYIEDLVRSLIDAYDSDKTIHLHTAVEKIELRIDTIVPLGLILNEIVSNSLKYAFAGKSEGDITVSMKRMGPNVFCLEVSDNGAGLPSTMDFRKSGTLGMQLIHMLADQLNGEISVRNQNGTHYRMVFREEIKERY